MVRREGRHIGEGAAGEVAVALGGRGVLDAVGVRVGAGEAVAVAVREGPAVAEGAGASLAEAVAEDGVVGVGEASRVGTSDGETGVPVAVAVSAAVPGATGVAVAVPSGRHGLRHGPSAGRLRIELKLIAFA